MKDEEQAIPTDYCYISSVTLGSVRRAIHTVDTLGRDSVYYTSYTGNKFEMIIDHRSLVIENRDSLLYGSQTGAILVNVTYEGAALLLRPADADSTEQWKPYNELDSLDLSKDLHLFVLANDANSSRTYTLRVNVHQQEGDSLYWNRVDSVDTFDAMQQTKAIVHDGMLKVLGSSPTGFVLARRSTLSDEGTWEAEDTDLPSNADLLTLRQRGSNLYVSTADGGLLASTDGSHWSELAPAKEGLQLIDVTDKYFYALMTDGIYRSADGTEWTKEALDESTTYLPAHTIHSVHLTQPNGNKRTVLVGYRGDGINDANQVDTTAMVWTKFWNGSYKEADAEWVYINQTLENKYFCPRLQHLVVLPYDGRCLAFGGASEEGRGHHTSMDGMYFSNDYGITWKADYELHLPTATRGVSGPITAAVDEDNYLWIIADGQVWRGRLNRLGFARR